MATKADDDNSRSDDRRWLRDEVAFIVEHARMSEAAALEYLLDRLHRNEIDWFFDKVETNFRGAGAPENELAEIVRRFFWRRYVFVQPHQVDLADNSAVRIGAAILGIRRDEKGDPQPIWAGRYSLTMRATLIKLHHPHVVRSLQRSRYMSGGLVVLSGQGSESIPAAPASLSSSRQSETLRRKPAGDRDTLKTWLPGAVEQWPPDKTDTGGLDLIEFYQSKAPKKWSRQYYHNALSQLRQDGVDIPPISRTKKF
jgi:hypothetical protein